MKVLNTILKIVLIGISAIILFYIGLFVYVWIWFSQEAAETKRIIETVEALNLPSLTINYCYELHCKFTVNINNEKVMFFFTGDKNLDAKVDFIQRINDGWPETHGECSAQSYDHDGNALCHLPGYLYLEK